VVTFLLLLLSSQLLSAAVLFKLVLVDVDVVSAVCVVDASATVDDVLVVNDDWK